MINAALKCLVRERGRWVLWLPVLFGIGIGFYFALTFEPPLWLGPLVVAAVATAGVALKRKGWAADSVLIAAMAGLSVVAAGFTVVQWRAIAVKAPVLSERIGPTAVTGRIASVETFADGPRVTLERPRIAGLGPERVPEKVRLRLRGRQPDLFPGVWIRVRAMLSPPPPPAAPGAFDFQRQSYFRRLGAVGFGLGPAQVIAGPDLFQGWFNPGLVLARVRQNLSARIRAGLEGTPGAIATALMTGDRSAIPKTVMKSIRDSGLAHLLAISGLHIGLVAGILFFTVRALLALVRPWALVYPIKKWAAAAAIAGAFAYALIAGATVPTLRAFMMVGLVLTAVMLDRRGLSMRLVAWAALAILILQPESLLGPSFQMSFAAVTALIAAYEFLSQRRRYREYGASALPPWLRKAGLYLSGVALTTVIAAAATAPFAMYHFNRIADYGLAANLVAVPVTALWVMPWAVAAFLSMPFGFEALALAPMGRGIEIIIAVAETVSTWQGAVTLVPAAPVAALALVALGGLWLALWRGRWRLYGIGGMVLGVAVAVLAQPPDVLVDGRGRLLAVRSADGTVAFSTLRGARFNRKVWLRRFGLDPEKAGRKWPKTGISPDKRLSCDIQGCLYRASGRVVALAFTEGALAEDCWRADVVIAVVPVRRACPAKGGVIDRFALWRDGGAAIWLGGPGRIRIETVNGVRGRRPWVVRPVARKKKSAPGT